MDSSHGTQQVYGIGFILNVTCNLFKIKDCKILLRVARISYILRDLLPEFIFSSFFVSGKHFLFLFINPLLGVIIKINNS